MGRFLIWTMITPMAANPIPIPSCQLTCSPRNIPARIAIWISMVLLIMLDSMADKTRNV